MRLYHVVLRAMPVLLCFMTNSLSAQVTPAQEGKKQLYLPEQIWKVPKGNDFTNNESEYSYQRMVQSHNLAIFWAKEFGDNPLVYADTAKRFDVAAMLKDCERFYNYYVDELKFVEKGHSVTDQYKILFFVFSGNEGTAFGGGEDNKVGILWTPASRVHRAPYGALAHELGHSFQYLVHADGAWGFTSAPEGSRGQSIFEMTSQYMLWQVHPNWISFENYHLVSFMKKTHYAFLHETNQYHSPHVLEYWSGKHGKDFIGKLWRQARKGEDPVSTYKRLTAINQSQFNDEIFEAARKFITWDLDRIREAASSYANQHIGKLDSIGNNEYRISQNNCPQNYGYNGIRLRVPAAGTTIKLKFKGITGNTTNGFRSIQSKKAGWRYGFLAVQENGTRIYGKTHQNPNGTASFKIPDNTKHLWLVVSGAPTEHWIHLTDGKDENDEQWPYEVALSGTRPE